jgi:hypothetical protein
MNDEATCLPGPGPRKPGRRPVLVIVFYLLAVFYAPALLLAGVPVEVVTASAPPVIALTVQMTRRARLWARPGPAASGAAAQVCA